MKILVIGARGMLGTDLVRAAGEQGHEVAGLDLPELDLTDPASLEARLPDGDVVVNCAAYTQVDQAESEREAAFRINGEGAGNLAKVCAARGPWMIQISTDYVFSGQSDRPWREEDAPAPVSAYGASKLAGEQAVRAAADSALIVRVESLFGTNGRNFVKTIGGRLRDGQRSFRVVADQVSSPTYTRHAAEGLLRLIKVGPRAGIVHMTASGACSWCDFARAIAARLAPDAAVEAVPSEAYPLPARRPAFSVLDTTRFAEWTGHRLPAWSEGLDEYLREEGWL